jgi:hypothetical protein
MVFQRDRNPLMPGLSGAFSALEVDIQRIGHYSGFTAKTAKTEH